MFTLFISTSQGQTKQAFGAGYFGELVTYKGFVFEYEVERMQSKNIALVSRSNLGFYKHPRSHSAWFIDQHLGLRRYAGAFYFESAVGLGVMASRLNEPVYEVNDKGEIEESGKWLNPDFMPSVTIGMGYQFGAEQSSALWVRPKIFWQYPYNAIALPHLALQIGFTHQISK